MAATGFKLTTPCNRCPFLITLPVPLREGRADEIATALLSGGSFHCHKTVDYSDDEPSTYGAQECAGALIILDRMGYPNQMTRIAQRLGAFDPAALDIDADVFDDLDEWIEAMDEVAER